MVIKIEMISGLPDELQSHKDYISFYSRARGTLFSHYRSWKINTGLFSIIILRRI